MIKLSVFSWDCKKICYTCLSVANPCLKFLACIQFGEPRIPIGLQPSANVDIPLRHCTSDDDDAFQSPSLWGPYYYYAYCPVLPLSAITSNSHLAVGHLKIALRDKKNRIRKGQTEYRKKRRETEKTKTHIIRINKNIDHRSEKYILIYKLQ